MKMFLNQATEQSNRFSHSTLSIVQRLSCSFCVESLEQLSSFFSGQGSLKRFPFFLGVKLPGMSRRRLPPPSKDFFNKNSISQEERLPFPNYRFTKYFWLINTQNAVFNERQAEYLSNVLVQSIVEVLGEGGVVAFAHPNHRWDRRFVGENELQIHIEIGPRKGRVHAHVIQEIKHRSTINIDTADVARALDQAISDKTGGRVEKTFVGRKIVPSSEPLREYVEKDEHDWSQDPTKPSHSKTYRFALIYSPEGQWIEETITKRRPFKEGRVGYVPTESGYKATAKVPKVPVGAVGQPLSYSVSQASSSGPPPIFEISDVPRGASSSSGPLIEDFDPRFFLSRR